MYRGLTGLLFGIAALGMISTTVDARDGCGRGMYYNGFRCAPEGPPGGYYGPPQGGGPLFQFGFDGRGGGDDRRYSPPSRRYNTWNGCPPRYTVQDGQCKPFTGR